MATSSYYEDLILSTSESVRNMEKAFEKADVLAEKIPYEEVRVCRDPERIRRIFE